MNRTTRFLQLAADVRRQSTMHIKVGAVLVRGNRVVKLASNKEGSGRRIRHTHLGLWSRHAEVRATINVDANGATVFVYREHASNATPLLAKPCVNCQEWLQYIGVVQAVYSIPEYPFFEVIDF